MPNLVPPARTGLVLATKALAAVVVLSSIPAAIAVEVTVARIDGSEAVGEWRGVCEGGKVRIGQAEFPLEELSRISFPVSFAAGPSLPHSARPGGDPKAAPATTAATHVIVHLPCRAVLVGTIGNTAGDSDSVMVQTAFASSLIVPFDSLAGIQFARDDDFPRAAEMFRAALMERKPGEDALFSRDLQDVNVARGRVERVDVEGGSFVFGDRSRSFRHEKLFGIVFAAGAAPPGRSPVLARMTDGSTISGRMAGADDARLRLVTPWGMTLEISRVDVIALEFASDRIVHLSDLKPKEQLVEGILHRSWPVGVDRNLAGGPMSIAGQTYEKGLGVHSRTSLTYEVKGLYESFASAIGLDDVVRPRGSVVFRVIGDGATLFDSGTIHGADEARKILVPIAGVKNLTLLVDYGDQLDIADQADWADARLILPVKAKPTAERGRPVP